MGRMLLNAGRIARLLSPDGFDLLFVNKATKDMEFVRPSRIVRLYEHLMIGASGKHGEVVYAQTTVSLVRYFSLHKCVAEVDNELLLALGTDKERHWTPIESSHDARKWEVRLGEIAGMFARNAANARGPGLLNRMAEALNSVENYIRLVGDATKIFDREHAFYQENSVNTRTEGERIAFGSGIQNSAWEDVNLAGLILAKYGSEIERRPDPWHGGVTLDSQVLPRICLLADFFHDQRLKYKANA